MSYGEDLANLSANVAKDVAMKVGEAATKFVGNIAKSILEILLLRIKNRPEKVKYGKTNLDEILRSGEEIKMVDMNKSDIKHFTKIAKEYGIQFAVIGKKNKENKIIAFKASEVERMEKALEAFIEEKMQKAEQSQEVKSKKGNKKPRSVKFNEEKEGIDNNSEHSTSKVNEIENDVKDDASKDEFEKMRSAKGKDKKDERPSVKKKLEYIKQSRKNNEGRKQRKTKQKDVARA